MYLFEKKSSIKCSQEELFHFHIDTQNLKQITPPDIKVTQLNENFEAKEGEILKLKTIKYGIPTIWEVQIQSLQHPTLLVDKALKSPFAFWEHSHIFTQKEAYCELKDVVKFRMPFGFIGRLFHPLILKDLQKMFDYRHRVTKEILEKKH